MTPRNRLAPDARGEQIIDAALAVACTSGLASLCTRAVADRLGCARSLVSHYYSIDTLRDLVVMRAAAVGCVRVVSQAIATDAALAPRLGEAMHSQAVAYLLTGGRCPRPECKARRCAAPRAADAYNQLDSQIDRD